MRLVAILAFVLTSSAFAGEYVSRKFSYSHFTSGWNQTYYNCSAVEDMVEAHLAALGATNARVNCSGGIQDMGGQWQYFPVNVTARFDAAVPSGGSVESRTLKSVGGNENCELNVGVLNKLLPLFPAVTVTRGTKSCSDNRSRWSYDITVAN